jgi:hypothetical protein
MKWNCTNCTWVLPALAAVGLTTSLAIGDGTPQSIDISGVVVVGGLGDPANETVKFNFGGPVAITGVGWQGSYCTTPGSINWVNENRIALGEQGQAAALFIAPGGPGATSPCPDCFALSSDGILKLKEFGICAIPILSGVVELEFWTTWAVQPPAGTWCDNSTLTIQYIEIDAPGGACPWDLNGDGEVNVLDLLDLLGAWGPNPGHPADFNGDGEVNVLDLLELLGNWGSCPPGGGALTGACCHGDAMCDELTEAECDALPNSIYLGDLCECDNFECPGEPAECPQGAFNEGEACGSDINGGCNSSPPIYSTICCGDVATGNAWADGGTRDTDWYTLVLDEETCVTITLEYSFGGLNAALFLINDQCPPALAIIAIGQDIGNNTMFIRQTVPAGTYRVFAATAVFDGLPCPGGAYTLSVSCAEPPCPNDGFLCPFAAPVQIDGPAVVFNNSGYPASAPACGGFTAAPGTVWYKVVGNGTTLTASSCGSSPSGTILTLYCGGCQVASCIAGSNEDHAGVCANPFHASVSWCAEDGAEYLIAVRGSGGAIGNISLFVESDGFACSAQPCITTPCPLDCEDNIGEPCRGASGTGDPANDPYNGGCNMTPPSYSTAVCGGTYCGLLWAEGAFRDLDWYRLDLSGAGAQTQITWSAEVDFPELVNLNLWIATHTCPPTIIQFASAECVNSITACVSPGLYTLIIAPSVFEGAPCSLGPHQYLATVTCASPCEGPPPPSCAGFCGQQHPSGCWCDALCCGFGDCCPDQGAVCGLCDPE